MGKKEMSVVDWIVFVLIVIGGLNWGFAVFNFNLISFLFGAGVLANIVYALVGLSALYILVMKFKKK